MCFRFYFPKMQCLTENSFFLICGVLCMVALLDIIASGPLCDIARWPLAISYFRYRATTKSDCMATFRQRRILVTARPKKLITWQPWGRMNATLHSRYRETTKRDRMAILMWSRCNVTLSLPHDHKKWLHSNLEATSIQCHIHVTTQQPQKVIACRPWSNIDAMLHSCYCATTKKWSHGDFEATSMQHCILITAWPQKRCMATLRWCQCNVAFSSLHDHSIVTTNFSHWAAIINI